MFRLLGFPEVPSEVSGNITTHQILRLLYADQLSPVDDLFKFEPFDSPLIRDTVGRFLCGAYDNNLYSNQLNVRAAQKEFDMINAELRSLYAVAGTAGQPLTSEWLAGQRAVLEEQRRSLRERIEVAERAVFSSPDSEQLSLKAQEDLYTRVQNLQGNVAAARQERDGLAFDVADSNAFISSLNNKIIALNDSEAVARHFSEIRFLACPACYTPLDVSADESPHACHLCKTPFDSERTKGRIVALINDTALQIKQSEALQKSRYERISKLDARIHAVEMEWREAGQRLNELRRLPSSQSTEELRILHRQSGYLEREIENLEERARIVDLIGQKARRKKI